MDVGCGYGCSVVVGKCLAIVIGVLRLLNGVCG